MPKFAAIMNGRILFTLLLTLVLHLSLCAQLRPTTGTPYAQDGQYGDNFNQDNEEEKNYIWGRDTTSRADKIVPIGSFCWTIDPRFGNITPAEQDTLPNNFQNFNNTAGPTAQYNFLGNLGSPRLSRLFAQRNQPTNFIFADPFDYFYTPINQFLFTNTLSPITNLSYHSCGNKQNGEDRLRAYFATNINKVSGIGFKTDYLYGRGYYNSQATSLFNGSLYGYYLGDRYNMHAWISVNHMRIGENGGIEDDRYITNPEDFTRSYGSSDIPTLLSRNWNRNEDQTYYLTHRYNMGFYRNVELPDSLMPDIPADSALLAAVTDSLITRRLATDTLYKRHITDSLRNDYLLKQDLPQEFIPVSSIIHTLNIRNAKHTVYSYNTPANYYADRYYGSASDKLADRTKAISLQNTLGIALREGFNKWAKAGLTLYAWHEYRHFILPQVADGVKIADATYSENNVGIGGELAKRQGHTIHYNVNAHATLAGTDAGSLDIDGTGDLNFRLWSDTVQLKARAYLKHQTPSFYMRHYHSQYAWWDNALSKELRTRIEGTLSLKRTGTALSVGVENIKDYTYFATTKVALTNDEGTLTGYANRVGVRQQSGSIQAFWVKLNQDFKLGILHWDNEIAYQKSSHDNVLPLPDLSLYSNLYIVFRIAKVLRVQFGADVSYFTEYYAPDYAPIIQQYTVQDPDQRIKIGNYPIINAYLNFHLKHCRFYINAMHVNEGMGNKRAFLAPHYPINPMAIHFGLSWNFFN